jgi:hypothetical protein
MPTCGQCSDALDDAPPGVDTCCKGCAWQARRCGDILTATEVKRLQMFAFLCAFEVAARDGLEVVPELD